MFAQPFGRAKIKENIKVPCHAFVRKINKWPLIPAQKASNAETVYIWWRHHGEISRTQHLTWNLLILNMISHVMRFTRLRYMLQILDNRWPYHFNRLVCSGLTGHANQSYHTHISSEGVSLNYCFPHDPGMFSTALSGFCTAWCKHFCTTINRVTYKMRFDD